MKVKVFSPLINCNYLPFVALSNKVPNSLFDQFESCKINGLRLTTSLRECPGACLSVLLHTIAKHLPPVYLEARCLVIKNGKYYALLRLACIHVYEVESYGTARDRCTYCVL